MHHLSNSVIEWNTILLNNVMHVVRVCIFSSRARLVRARSSFDARKLDDRHTCAVIKLALQLRNQDRVNQALSISEAVFIVETVRTVDEDDDVVKGWWRRRRNIRDASAIMNVLKIFQCSVCPDSSCCTNRETKVKIVSTKRIQIQLIKMQRFVILWLFFTNAKNSYVDIDSISGRTIHISSVIVSPRLASLSNWEEYGLMR